MASITYCLFNGTILTYILYAMLGSSVARLGALNWPKIKNLLSGIKPCKILTVC